MKRTILTAALSAALILGATPAHAATPSGAESVETEAAATGTSNRITVSGAGWRSAGTIGMSRLSGSTFNLGVNDTVETYNYPSGSSARATHTGRGWCVVEEVGVKRPWWQPGGYSHRTYYHPYTTRNGGWSQLGVAGLSYEAHRDGRDFTGTAVMRLKSGGC